MQALVVRECFFWPKMTILTSRLQSDTTETLRIKQHFDLNEVFGFVLKLHAVVCGLYDSTRHNKNQTSSSSCGAQNIKRVVYCEKSQVNMVSLPRSHVDANIVI